MKILVPVGLSILATVVAFAASRLISRALAYAQAPMGGAAAEPAPVA